MGGMFSPNRRNVSQQGRVPTMKSAKPSITTNQLHFTDLDPARFEDLCLALIYPLHPWREIRHYGRQGGDGGVDILSIERLEDNVERHWFIQCRRYAKVTTATLRKAVDDALGNTPEVPTVLLIVVASNVQRAAHEAYVKYAAEKGVATPLLWTASVLEAQLYAQRQDLLFSYFGISLVTESRYREDTITRSIAMKRKLRAELLKPPTEVDWDEVRNHRPYEKFAHSAAIIHSIDDTSYPDSQNEGTGISGWFKLEMWDFYHNGLEFIVWLDAGIVDSEDHWAILEHGHRYDQEKYTPIKIFRLARIPFRNIVEIDVIGDEYYSQPHLFCRFADGGAPYEGFRHVLANDGYPYPMEPTLRFQLSGRSKEAGQQTDVTNSP
jgi:hypothetical protein